MFESVNTEGYRAFTITPTDHGGQLIISATVLLSWMVLCLFVRLWIRYAVSGPFGWDDLTVTIASLFGVAQTAAVIASVSEGFGKSAKILDESQIRQADKSIYAADILFLIAHCLAKCSVILLLARISRLRGYLLTCYGMLGATAAWGVGSIFAISLRCTLSHPWLDEKCTDVFLRWQVITAFDVIIEAVLLCMAIYLVWNLQMPLSLKIVVVVAFGFRVPVIIAAVIRVHQLKIGIDSSDPTFAALPGAICTGTLMNYSLIAATIPCLKPFIISFNTQWGMGTTPGGSYAMQSFSSKRTPKEAPGSKVSHVSSAKDTFRPDLQSHISTIAHNSTRGRKVDEAESITSQDSRQMIIRHTTGWNVSYDQEGRETTARPDGVGHAV